MVKVLVSAGHSNKDPGAVCHGVKEADIACDLRNYTAFYLRQADVRGLEVVTDGEGDINLPLVNAASLARGCDYAVEFHMNAAKDQQVYGVECLSQPKDKKLAQAIAREITKVTKTNIRGVMGWKPENSGQHTRLAFVRAGGIIIEVDFITNALMCETVVYKRWLVAKAVATAILDYLKSEVKL